MLGALLFWYVTLDDPTNPGVPLYPPPHVYRMLEAAPNSVRQEFLDAAQRAGIYHPRLEALGEWDKNDPDEDCFAGIATIFRGRAISRRIPGDRPW